MECSPLYCIWQTWGSGIPCSMFYDSESTNPVSLSPRLQVTLSPRSGTKLGKAYTATIIYWVFMPCAVFGYYVVHLADRQRERLALSNVILIYLFLHEAALLLHCQPSPFIQVSQSPYITNSWLQLVIALTILWIEDSVMWVMSFSYFLPQKTVNWTSI